MSASAQNSDKAIYTNLKGGEFVIKKSDPKSTFSSEDITEEQRMIYQTCSAFIEQEILPKEDELDLNPDSDLMPTLLKKAGELGLLGTSISEQYGGFGMNITTSMLVADGLGGGGSFAVAFSAHTGIGTLPIALYGNQNQKDTYLSALTSGSTLAAYCLTEPDSGSDANSGKTKAILHEGGEHYIINGQKMWITNAGFADLYIVFAKINDDKNLTAFIIEGGTEGLSMNEEEKKMGIKGSSTRQIFLTNCKVHQSAILGGRGNGFRIALNVLNVGRIKLGAAVLGGARRAIEMALHYADERKQFGKSISQYGAIKSKIGKMRTKIFGLESALYRLTHQVDQLIDFNKSHGFSYAEAKLKAMEDFAIESAILKVYGSEVLDFVVDENVQIHGGMGFSAEAKAEKSYRDARINRIFEGTNEINRLLMVAMLLKKGMKGQLDIIGPALKVASELTSLPSIGEADLSPLSNEKKVLRNAKKALLLVSGAAIKQFGEKIEEEQEIMMNAADVMIMIYVLESAILRTEKLIEKEGEEKATLFIKMTKCLALDTLNTVDRSGKEAIYSFDSGDEMNMMLMGLKRFVKSKPINVKEYRREIADEALKSKSASL